MELNEYQAKAFATANYPSIGASYVYPALGLAGEAGEVVEKVKKIFRNHNGVVTDEYRDLIKKELGDVLWYMAVLSQEFDFKLEDVAKLNIEKLASRAKRGALHSDGDNR
ncbi:nucleoside triphosphate pyrophosphohydrolase family protein [Candidatus Falkowbacteria bacterium]|nr:MAG: nucleoside triphosphate pyrophosphohydrolase family protein [Candidatus Falkowbacteria bacterium]